MRMRLDPSVASRLCFHCSVADADWPEVSLVFVAYNRRDKLAISLEKVLEELDYPYERLEVIVVDNASTDGTTEMVRERFPQVQLIRQPENVGATAWNVGMATARGQWRMILDDDCYIEGDALKVAVRRAGEHRADLVSFLVASSIDRRLFNHGVHSPGLLGFVGCAAMFSDRAIESEPFYDPNLFIWGNELELTMRLLDRGFRHLYLPEVVAVHQKPVPTGDRPLNFFAVNHRHWAYSAGKLMRPADAVAVVARLLLRIVLDARHRDPTLVKAIPGIFAGFAQGLRCRRPVRPVVSAAYREACFELSNPLTLVRTPLQRLRTLGDEAAANRARAERREQRHLRHRRYYSEDTAVLEL
jgi:GT2 family glycosyltransferase